MEILCPGFGPPILINHDESYPDETQIRELATQIVEAVLAALNDGTEIGTWTEQYDGPDG